MNRIFFGIGLCLLLSGAVWFFVLSPRVLHAPTEYTTTLHYEAMARTRAALNEPLARSHFSEKHETRVVAVEGPEVTLETSTTFTDLVSGAVVFEDTSTLRFDKDTLQITGSEALARFPAHLNPRDYLLKQFSYLPDSGVPFRFQGAERISGHDVYRFDFEAAGMDWTDSYGFDLDGTAWITARDLGSVWVDPSTGFVVQHTEEWSARVKGGAHDGRVVDEGRMWLSPASIDKQLLISLNHHRVHVLYEVIIPIVLTVIGMIVILLSIPRARR